MATPVHLTPPVRRWWCPNCTLTARTQRADAHTRFHHCRGLAGLWAPMLEAGQRARIVAVERDDYVGSDHVQTDGNGRPVMAVHTLRDDGSNDLTLYAPAARLGALSVPAGG